MKKAFAKILSVVLALTMLSAIAVVGFTSASKAEAAAVSISELAVGDLIQYGSYPQTRIKDENLIDELNALDLSWTYFDYYYGDGDTNSMVLSEFMKYSDVEYKGEKYRAVEFSSYRPDPTYFPLTTDGKWSEQDENGYVINTVYWFRFEPLTWRVLDPSDGYVLSEVAIDAQAYQNLHYTYMKYVSGQYIDFYYNSTSRENYGNDYATSSIREWLNDDFINTAFTDSEQENIKITELDNRCMNEETPEYDSETTFDKVFLPSYFEIINAEYGFDADDTSCEARKRITSDYARIQGAEIGRRNYFPAGFAFWMLRSPGRDSMRYGGVDNDGEIVDTGYMSSVSASVCPAIRLDTALKVEKVYKVSYSFKKVANEPELPCISVAKAGETIIVPEADECSGYSFDGWYDDNGVKYEAGSEFTVPQANVTLTGEYDENIYTAYFDTNGAEPIDPVTRYYDYSFTLPVPVKDDYRFDGWMLDGELITKTYMDMPARDITLVAKWTQLFDVTYLDADGSVYEYMPNAAGGGDAIPYSTLDRPQKEGLYFDKWVDSETGEEIEIMPEKDLFLEPVFKESDSGNTGEVIDKDAVKNEVLTFRTEFYRYDEATDDWVQTYGVANGDRIKARLFIDTTYATNSGEVLIFYDRNMFMLNTSDSVQSGDDGLLELKTNSDPDSSAYINGVTGVYIDAEESNYVIDGLYEDGYITDEEYLEKGKILLTFHFDSSINRKISGEKWFAEFDFDVIGYGSGTLYVPENAIQNPDYGYYAFINVPIGVEGETCFNNINLFDVDLRKNVYSAYAATEGCVNFVLDGGFLYGDDGTEYYDYYTAYGYIGEPIYAPSPMREGFVFCGWIDDYGNQVYEPIIIPYEATTYRAIWECCLYEVCFDANGGRFYDGTETMYQYYEYGSMIDNWEIPYKDGCEFAGWSTEPYGEPVYDYDMVLRDPYDGQTFYAVWQPINYTLSYSFEGDVPNGAISPVPVTAEYGSTVELASPELIDGYEFDGWYFEGNLYEPGSAFIMPASDVSLLGVWIEKAPEIYRIILDANGGQFADGSEIFVREYIAGEEISIPDYPEKEGYDFCGWVDENGNVDIPQQMPEMNLRLFAKWEPAVISYTVITYIMNTEGTYDSVIQNMDGVMDEYIQVPIPEIEEGFTLREDKSVLSGVIHPDAVFEIYVDREKYSITVNGETEEYYYGTEINEPGIPELEGLEFTGWSDTQGNKIEFPYTVKTSDVEIVPMWKASEYEVKYIIADKTFEYRVSYGSEVPVPDVTSLDGIIFEYWKNENGDKTEIPVTMPAEDLLFVAKTEMILSSDANGVTATFDDDCFENGSDMSKVKLVATEDSNDQLLSGGDFVIDNETGNRFLKTGLFNIKMFYGEEPVRFNENKTVKLRIPLGNNKGRSCYKVIHRKSSGGVETFDIRNPSENYQDDCLIVEVSGFSEFEVYTITYEDAKLISAPAKTNYTYKTDSVDLSGIAIEITYADGRKETVTDTSRMKVVGFDNTKIGTQTATVECEGQTVQFEVTVSYAWWQWIIRILLLGFLWY